MSVYEWTAEWALKSNLKLWQAETCESTNSVAKNDSAMASAPSAVADASGVSEPTLYLTKEQTAGRGRGDNTWVTPKEDALLCSWSFAIGTVPQPVFSPLVGLALFEAAREAWRDVPFSMKAP